MSQHWAQPCARSDMDIAHHMQENNLSFPNFNDSDGLMAQKWIAVTPTIIILKDGKMIHHTSGFLATSA